MLSIILLKTKKIFGLHIISNNAIAYLIAILMFILWPTIFCFDIAYFFTKLHTVFKIKKLQIKVEKLHAKNTKRLIKLFDGDIQKANEFYKLTSESISQKINEQLKQSKTNQ